MDHLPADLLLPLLEVVRVVVAVEVAVQRAHHDGRDDTREEHNDEQRLDDGAPVNVGVAVREAGVEVRVPTRRPAHVLVLNPLDAVRPHNRRGLGEVRRGDGLVVSVHIEVRVARRLAVFEAVRHDVEADDAVLRLLGVSVVWEVVLDRELEVVVDESVPGTALLYPERVATHVVPPVAVLALATVRERARVEARKVVDDHMSAVLILNEFGKQRELALVHLCLISRAIQTHARHVLAHLHRVHGHLDVVAPQNFTKGLRAAPGVEDGVGGTAERSGVVRLRHQRIDRAKRVDLDGDVLSVRILDGLDTREVEPRRETRLCGHDHQERQCNNEAARNHFFFFYQ
eukprot:PhM_4_TR18815/c0_g1_i3/m.35859/K00648/fabH; 3-oxoacyl-[acyl-carrier-protein] synthase III